MSYYPNSVTCPEGPEYDDPLPQARCRCGRFMSNTPITRMGGNWDYDYVYSPDGDPILKEVRWIPKAETVFICTSCGAEYDDPPNWRGR